MHEVGLEPTNHEGTALEAAGFDRFPIRAWGSNPVHDDLSPDEGLEPSTTSLKG